MMQNVKTNETHS